MFNLKKSYLLFALSLTYSLCACNNPANTIITQQSIKPSAGIPLNIKIPPANNLSSPGPGTIVDLKPVPNINEVLREGPNTAGTKPAFPTGSSNPVGQTGGTSDIKERATFNGKIYDPKGNTVEGAKVTARSVDANISWDEEQISTNGTYVFRNAPVGARVMIAATKEGWTTRSRTEVLKSNLQGDPTANVFDFGGINPQSSQYAIQDEPEIISVNINGKRVSAPGNNDNPGLRNVSNNQPGIEFIFSEPVNKENFESSLRLISQSLSTNESVTIDNSSSDTSFVWGRNDTAVKFILDKPLVPDANSSETIYRIEFSNGFKDKSGLEAVKGKYIMFNTMVYSDYLIFSVKS